MKRKLLFQLTGFKKQFLIVLTISCCGYYFIRKETIPFASSDYISSISVIITILTLFCSMVITWTLFYYQRAKTNKEHLFEKLEKELDSFIEWLSIKPAFSGKSIIQELVIALRSVEEPEYFHLGKMQEYEEINNFLGDRINLSPNLNDAIWKLARIETAINKLQILTIEHISTFQPFYSLMKGVFIICIGIIMITLCPLFFKNHTTWFITSLYFISSWSILLLSEIIIISYYDYYDSLFFIERKGEE